MILNIVAAVLTAFVAVFLYSQPYQPTWIRMGFFLNILFCVLNLLVIAKQIL